MTVPAPPREFHLYHSPATRGLAVLTEKLDSFGASFESQDG